MFRFVYKRTMFLRLALRKPFRWISLFFLIWIYRTIFIASDDGGLAAGLQIFSLTGMFFLVYRRWPRCISRLTRTNMISINTLLLFYGYALLSVLWAYKPFFACFMVVQNFVFILLTFWMFSLLDSFRQIEKALVYFLLIVAIFSAIGARLIGHFSLFIHLLQTGSVSALCVAYCFGEWIKENKDKRRKCFLRNSMICGFILLITSTSSGANASAIAGMGAAMFFCGKAFWGVLIITAGVLTWFFRDQMMDLLLIIMPGKTRESVESVTGRERLWNDILYFARERPLFGWGFACVERVVSEKGSVLSPDAHNNYLGFYGSLGFVGCIFAGIHLFSSLSSFILQSKKLGFTGLTAAMVTALFNGYSYGFLSGKGCIITISYFAIITVGYHFLRVQRK